MMTAHERSWVICCETGGEVFVEGTSSFSLIADAEDGMSG